MSTIKKQMKTLLNKGTLTGFEVAQVMMHDLYEATKISEPFLFDEEDGACEPKIYKQLIFPDLDDRGAFLRRNLSGNKFKADEYRDWLNAFHPFLEIVYIGHIYYLKITSLISYLGRILMKYKVEEVISFYFQICCPDIVTEKQLTDLKAKQRAALLKGKQPLGWVLVLESETDGFSAEELLEGTAEEQAALVANYRKACIRLRNQIKKGKSTITRKKDALALLNRLHGKASDKDILGYIDMYIAAEPERRPTTPEPLLDKCTIQTKALYELGLSFWVSWIDDYKHNLGGPAPYHLAVIKDPMPENVDKKGYYKKLRLTESPLVNPEHGFTEDKGYTLRGIFKIVFASLDLYIALFQVYRCIAKVLTDETGICFSEKLDMWYADIEARLKDNESLLATTIKTSKKAGKTFDGMQGAINLNNLTVDDLLVEKFRKSLTREDARYWVNECLKLYYEYEREKAQDKT